MDETIRRLTSNRARNKYRKEKEQYDLSCQKPRAKTRAHGARWNDTIEQKRTSKHSKPHATHRTARYRGPI
jgi:hypothetical protein